MKLTRVTITGADDGVDIESLSRLRREYPFVEWGILVSMKRFGQPRYPSSNWHRTLIEGYSITMLEHCSIHACGELSRRIMGGDPTMVPKGIKRLQLNGFSDYTLPCLLCAEGAPEVEFILQCSTLEAVERAEALVEGGLKNVVALWDLSGGKGVQMENWPLPLGPLRIGFAGGINENNIVRLTEKLLENREPHPFWIDLESGARTDDKFDLDKVRRILELAKPFVVAP